MYLTPAQSEIARDRHRFRVLRCGRRFGKTSLASEEIKGVAVAGPSRIAYIANNYQQARDIMWELLKKELRGAIIETNESRLEIRVRTIKGGETFIVLRGWESVENLRGQAFHFIVIDEVAQMRNFWVNWHEVIRPTLTDYQGSVMFTSTPKGFNHFFDLCNLELTDSDFKSFHFSSYDNPHLLTEELENAKQTLPPDRFSQEYLAEFTKTAGLVYKEFSRTKHVYTDGQPGIPLLTETWDKVAGIDFGYQNPAAILHIRTDGERFFVEDEWYKRERTERQIAEYVVKCKFASVYPDPENPSAIEELRRAGVNVREVAKGKDSVVSGVQKIRELLLSRKLMVHSRCKNLIAEFEMYSYNDESGEKDAKEKPLKANDHALDALRYVVFMMLPQLPAAAVQRMIENAESKSNDPY